MLYYRCRCGKSVAYGSMPPARCIACSLCGSDLAIGPTLHEPPEPHHWVTESNEFEDQQTGETRVASRSYCIRCLRAKPSAEPAAPALPVAGVTPPS